MSSEHEQRKTNVPAARESDEELIEARVLDLRVQYALATSRVVAWGSGITVAFEVILWLMFRDYPQLALLPGFASLAMIGAALYPFLHRRGYDTIGIYLLLTSMSLNVFVGALVPAVLVPLAIVTVLIVILSCLLLGGRDSLWFIGFCVLILTVVIVLAGTWTPNRFPALEERIGSILTALLTAFALVIVTFIVRLIVMGQEEQFRRAQLANLEVERRMIAEQEQRERERAQKEQERLLMQVQEQAKRVQQIIETVPEGVLLLDGDRRIVLANPVAKKDLAVLVDHDVLSTHDSITHLGDCSLAEVLTSPPTKGLWHEVQAVGHTFEIIARPMENGPGLENWVLVIRDVTREREIQQRLQQQERLAAVGQLAAGIAHDFNNIMATIVLYAQTTARAEGISDRVQEQMDTINQQAKHATRLIQQILDFSRRAVLERQPLNLSSLLKEHVKLLERTLPESIQVKLTWETDEHAALFMVNADPTRIQQVIMNLAVNARDTMPEGGELRIALSRTANTDEIRCVTCGPVVGEEWVRIAVTDTGSGIPPDVLPHIFEPFFTTKEASKGTGLGLAQVYGIVKQHDGHIDLTTEVGEGATFVLYLPALLEHRPEVPTLETQALVQGQGETILVVEDNAALRKALADTLELLNYRVLEAANGREALDMLEQRASEIALVLSDLVMPEIGGQALFHAMRQCDLILPVVMLTGHPMKSELESLQRQGLAGWLLKPPDPEQLSQLLAQVLSGDAD